MQPRTLDLHIDDLCAAYGIRRLHLVGEGRSGRRLESEEAAWRFALAEALVAPTDTTRRRIGKRLRSYVTWAELRARRRRPPFMPPANDPFWNLLAWLER